MLTVQGGVENMEKIKITLEQEKALNGFKEEFSNHDALEAFIEGNEWYLDFSPEQFALLLCGWYTVIGHES